MYAIYSKKCRRIERRHRQLTTKTVDTDTILENPTFPTVSTASTKASLLPTDFSNDKELRLEIDDLLREHQDEIHRPKPLCTLHRRDSFSTISTRSSAIDNNHGTRRNLLHVKGDEHRNGEFVPPSEISFPSTQPQQQQRRPKNDGDNHNSSRANNSLSHFLDLSIKTVLFQNIRKDTTNLVYAMDEKILDIYEDDYDDDIMFVPVKEDDDRRVAKHNVKKKHTMIRRKESMGIDTMICHPPARRSMIGDTTCEI